MRPGWVAWVLLLLVGAAGSAHAAPPDVAIIPVERYSTDKARSLATTHQRQLKQIYEVIYRCHEWMDIQRLGFVTQESSVLIEGEKEKMIVYLPHSFQVSGEMIVVPKENVKFLSLPPETALKMIMSAGIVKS